MKKIWVKVSLVITMIMMLCQQSAADCTYEWMYAPAAKSCEQPDLMEEKDGSCNIKVNCSVTDKTCIEDDVKDCVTMNEVSSPVNDVHNINNCDGRLHDGPCQA